MIKAEMPCLPIIANDLGERSKAMNKDVNDFVDKVSKA